MSRDHLLFLDDIALASERIVRYTIDLSFEDFLADDQARDAVLHNLAVIGEAVKHVPDEVRHRYPLVEWRKIAGLRDIVMHEYFGVDYDIIWDVVRNEVPELQAEIRAILVAEESR